MSSDLADFEGLIGRVLRNGMRGAIALLSIGLLLGLVHPRGVESKVLIHSGLAVVLLTPVARIVSSIVYFFRERDWLFVAATMCVLSVIGTAFVSALTIALR